MGTTTSSRPSSRASARSSARHVRLRAAVAPVALGVLLAVSACGSDSDSSTDPGDSVAVADPPVDTALVDTTVADVATTVSVPADDSPECGGISAAEVGAAAGADFDAADDISVDTDVSCLFSNAMAVDAVTVMTEPVATYLGGSLDGLSPEEALAQLQTSSSMFFDEPVAEQTTIGGVPAIVVTGTAMGSGIGSASAVVDGVVIEVSASGGGLSADGSGYGPIVTAVLELAVAAQG